MHLGYNFRTVYVRAMTALRHEERRRNLAEQNLINFDPGADALLQRATPGGMVDCGSYGMWSKFQRFQRVCGRASQLSTSTGDALMRVTEMMIIQRVSYINTD